MTPTRCGLRFGIPGTLEGHLELRGWAPTIYGSPPERFFVKLPVCLLCSPIGGL